MIFSPILLLLILGGYLGVILCIAWITSYRQSLTVRQYVSAGKAVPWWLVAFGMIGNSLSGVTFISVPGQVTDRGMTYFQTVLGYMLGYLVIAWVLLPVYYRLNISTIYTVLRLRLGEWPYKTGAFLFLVSRLLGASARLYLVTGVLQVFIFGPWGIPLPVTAGIALLLIMLYTLEGGMKTLVWTDTLQSLFLLASVVLTVYLMGTFMDESPFQYALNSRFGTLFNWDPAQSGYFWKDVIGGMCITIAMTGLDQDQMQKNLICKDIRAARQNMVTFSLIVVGVNFFFLVLGALLYLYSDVYGISLPERTDHAFPFLALGSLSTQLPVIGILFMLGLTAAAFSSADGAITALTTSWMVDIAGRSVEDDGNRSFQRKTHFMMALMAYLCILLYYGWDEYLRASGGKGLSIITVVLQVATYTYGPLIGLFMVALLGKRKLDGWPVALVCLMVPVACLILNINAETWFGYVFGFELLLLNGILTALCLWGLSLFASRDSST